MAVDSSLDLRRLVIYSIYIRNFSQQGDFKSVIGELDRIKKMGVDMIWFLPHYPIGQVKRKGSKGSPYAIQDYREVNPELGSRQDFIDLIDAIHQANMKVMIDIVYNHTSPDSVLSQDYPEWFYKKADGSFGNHIGEWTDVIDLEYKGNPNLWDYQIETLCDYAKLVDGFRCDVAPLVPLEFWLKARKAVKEVNPDLIWLAESVEPSFIKETRRQGITGLSDSQVYQAFDLTYDYDIDKEFIAYLKGELPLSSYVKAIDRQFWTYPVNFTKLRFLENHDQARIVAKMRPDHDLKQLMAFNFFLPGAHLIYNGQEVQATHLPSLFEKDPIDWDWDQDISADFKSLIELKKTQLPVEASFSLGADDDLDAVWARYEAQEDKWLAIFSLTKEHYGLLQVPVADGTYQDLISGQTIQVTEGQLQTGSQPLYFKY